MPKVVVNPGIDNSVEGRPGVTIADVGQLRPSDYRLRHNGTDFQLTRLPDNTPVPLEPDPDDPNVLLADGLRIDTAELAGATKGDIWLIQPTRFAATDLKMAMTDPARIAATSGALAEASNTGEARPVALRMSETDPPTPETYLPAVVVANADGDAYSTC
jgi:flagellar hook-associated protein 1